MCVVRLLSSEPFRRGRRGANATNGRRTAEGAASRPLAHKAGPIGPGSTCQELSGSVGIGPAGPSGSVRNRQEVSDGEPREALVRSRLF
jgi:hypothetical protein